MNDLFLIDDLVELADFLSGQNEEQCRADLLALFFHYAEYKNLEDWNKAVRLCEALAIMGWGDYEPVEARKGIFFNGNPETRFLNKDGESRFVDAIWSKRKDGYTMEQGRTSYHASPDIPNKTTLFHEHPVTEDIQTGKFSKQRNWIAKNPVVITSYIANCYPGSQAFMDDVQGRLNGLLNERMRPEIYGNALNRIVFYYSLSYEWANYIIADADLKLRKSEQLAAELEKHYSKEVICEHRYFLRHRFNYGGFLTKKGTMKVELALEKDFSNLPLHKQRTIFTEYLLQGVKTAIAKLKKKRLAYDFDSMEADFEAVVTEWCNGVAP